MAGVTRANANACVYSSRNWWIRLFVKSEMLSLPTPELTKHSFSSLHYS